MYKNKKILAIIPARGKSSGIKRKNIKPLAGKSLIAYTIETALKSQYLDRVIVSTEDKKIAKISKQYGAEVMERPKNLTRDNTPVIQVLRHVVNLLSNNEKYIPDIVVLLQPTSPLRRVDDINLAIRQLLEKKSDSVVSLCQTKSNPYWTYKLKNDNKICPIIKSKYNTARRQDAPKTYKLNGAVYVTKRNVLMDQNKILGKNTRAIIMPQERSVDIDTLLDFKMVELSIQKNQQ